VPAVNRDALLLAARDAELKRDLSQALRYYRQLLQSEPENFRLQNNIAGICIQQGNYGDALTAARQALARQAGYLPALINAGIAAAQLGKNQEAATAFGDVLAREPQHRGALYNLAVLREKSGGYPEAGALYQRLGESGDPQGYLGLGRVEERQQRPQAARQAYRALLAMPGVAAALQQAARERLRQLE
jgi:Tfp pilus assembly protein PilF